MPRTTRAGHGREGVATELRSMAPPSKTCVALQYVRSAGSSGSTLAVATSLPSQLISTVVNVQFAAVPVTYQ